MPARLYLASDSEPQSGRDSGSIRVVLAVDHDALRRTLRRLLDRDGDIEVIADPPDLVAAMESVVAGNPRVLVIDLRLTDGGDPHAIRTVRAQAPDTQIVVVTMHESPLAAQQVIDAGAIGFVLKDRADSELTLAIHRVARGEEFVSSRVADGLEALRCAARDGLSPRETEVVRLIALGHTSAEIAAMLSVSRRTVETQRARIYEKLGLTNRAGLVQFALRRRLIGC
jgi:two-component system, NarL family, response regulator NreC